MVGLLLYIWYNIPNGNLIDGIYAKSNPGLTTALNLLVVLFLRCICTDQVVSGFSFSNCGIDIQARHTLALDQCLHNPQHHNTMCLVSFVIKQFTLPNMSKSSIQSVYTLQINNTFSSESALFVKNGTIE